MTDKGFNKSNIQSKVSYFLEHLSPKAAILAGMLAYFYEHPPVTKFEWSCFWGIIGFTAIGGIVTWHGAGKVAQ